MTICIKCLQFAMNVCQFETAAGFVKPYSQRCALESPGAVGENAPSFAATVRVNTARISRAVRGDASARPVI